MILPDQAIDIDRSQLHLVAHRLAQPRCAPWHRFGSWRRLFRQFTKKSVVSHHRSSKSICLENHIRLTLDMKRVTAS
jgi:hypothetical protein